MDLGERKVNLQKVDLTTTNTETKQPNDLTTPANQMGELGKKEEKQEEWEEWSQKAEEWLLTKYGVNKKPYKGRGQKDRTDKRVISAPQNAKEGHAHNAKGRELQRDCNR